MIKLTLLSQGITSGITGAGGISQLRGLEKDLNYPFFVGQKR
jgi:hypothetical protein